jgi:SAM-dependent methyltransferase
MSMQVLQNEAQIAAARRTMRKMGVSFIDSPLRARLRRLGWVRAEAVGDHIKSWDVLETLRFLQRHVSRDEAVLDIGCYASEVLLALHKLGYRKLAGVDLNPNIKKMAFQQAVNYQIGDFLQTPFADAAFKAITAVSVIEHGFQSRRLLTEVSRLLQPGGFFVASFDYWPQKIDTTGVTFFDMEWKIFSREEVGEFLAQARDFGLEPLGSLTDQGDGRVVHCGGKQYTFAWLVLKKRP